MSESQNPTQFEGAILSLGGSPQGQAYSIAAFKPRNLLLLVSKDTRLKLGELQELTKARGADWPQTVDYMETKDPESLEECYLTAAHHIPKWLDEHELVHDEVIIDPTGGTKPMTAGLVLYCASRFHYFNYVGGTQRDKGGVGVVTNGTEKLKPFRNPEILTFDEAFRRWQRYVRLARYKAVVEESREYMDKLSPRRSRLLCGLISGIYEGVDAYDRFDWDGRKVGGYLQAVSKLEDLVAYDNHSELGDWLKDLQTFGEHYKEIQRSHQKLSLILVHALLANALRRAECEEKYEEAVAILYSAFERRAKLRIYEIFGHDTSKFPRDLVPESIREDFIRRHQIRTSPEHLQFGVESSMELLRASNDEFGRRYASEGSIWTDRHKNPLTRRNESILGHGLSAVHRDDFQRFWDATLELWGLNQDQLPRVPALPDISPY